MSDFELFDEFILNLQELSKSKLGASTKNKKEAALQLAALYEEFVVRNKKFTELLNSYAEQRETRIKINRTLKIILFVMFCVLFTAFSTIICVVFLRVDFNDVNLPSAVSLLSASFTYLASMLGIFKIISKHFFPLDEEQNTIEMIKTVINSDAKAETALPNIVKENKTSDIERLKMFKSLLDCHAVSEEEYNKLKQVILKNIEGSESKK